METLIDLGEKLPAEVLPEFIENLLSTGQGPRAREIVAEIEDGLDSRTATNLGWICHRLHAPDLAFRFFVLTLTANLNSVKFLSALESDAMRAGRAQDLLELYRARAQDQPRLWGRMRNLQRRLERGAR
jgi:hypothetical protein